MDKQESRERLQNLYSLFAEMASEDESVADSSLRARGVDPDEFGASMMANLRRLVADAKADHERYIREASRPQVKQHLQSLLEKFGSATEALRHGLGDEELSVQYRNLDSEPTEEEALEMLKEEVELRLSDEE